MRLQGQDLLLMFVYSRYSLKLPCAFFEQRFHEFFSQYGFPLGKSIQFINRIRIIFIFLSQLNKFQCNSFFLPDENLNGIDPAV
jgi:hypothetical protein